MENYIPEQINKDNSILKTKSFLFAVRIVKLAQYLQKEKGEFILSKQILRSGTSVGALVREAEYAQSKADFIHKLSIALKEANETDYWLSLLFETKYIEELLFKSLKSDCSEIIYILISSVKTVKNKIK